MDRLSTVRANSGPETSIMDYRQIVNEDAKPLIMPDDKSITRGTARYGVELGTITDLQCKDVDG